jgi:hypothetical protein
VFVLGEEEPSIEVPLPVSASTALCALTIEPQESSTIAKRSSHRRYAFEKLPVDKYSQEQERRDRLQAAVSQNQTALELSQELYTSGLGDFLAVLDAERQLYGNEDLLAQSQSAVTTNLIALYKALGGGWESFPQQ